MTDKKKVELQLGKAPKFPFFVAVRCRYGYPVVIATAPLWKGVPFPTVFWLTCPVLNKAVGSLESQGFQSVLEYRGEDEDFLMLRLYISGLLGVKEKITFFPKWGRIAGGRKGHIKCLHAHLATYLVTGKGPGKHVWFKVRDVMDSCKGPEYIMSGINGISK